ncbi:MAG: hypothetical protein NTZ73_01400 [Candidatus Diapherotrites archaeon]|nr:hypothetical protein [Candidatus Diapherotrites archaeon]
MPFFKKKLVQKIIKENPNIDRYKLEKEAGQSKKGKRIIYGHRKMYFCIHSSLKEIDRDFGHNLIKEINLLKKTNRNKKIRILDWGCGTGRAIRELALQNKRMEFIGFSKDSYIEWKNYSRKNLKFAHTTFPILERYLKKNPVHLMYSRLGITHLAEESTKFESIKLINHLMKLREGLIIGGKILIAGEIGDIAKETLEKSGFAVEFRDRPKYEEKISVLTRIK